MNLQITEAVKHIIILNVLFYIATYYMVDTNFMVSTFSLHSIQSPLFKPWQPITHMFMHGGFSHILFNMFSLWMFGSQLENRWKSKKFVIFYVLTGVGAALIYMLIKYIQASQGIANASDEMLNIIMTKGADAIASGQNFSEPALAKLNALVNGQMLGASGAISGLLMAFGIMFPNTELMLMFLPVPIKAKYFIPLLIIYEFSMEFANFSSDNVAHLAHLSGMLIGFILMKVWAKNEFRQH